MMIEVQLVGEAGFRSIPDYVLSEMLARGKVEGFRRSSGWVVVGRDPIRKPGGDPYYGPERRQRRFRSCLACPEMVNGECVNAVCPVRRSQTKIFPLGYG